jgi:hypothetical protein
MQFGGDVVNEQNGTMGWQSSESGVSFPNINGLFKPVADINESKASLQKISAIRIEEKLVVFSDRAFEKKFVLSLERNLVKRATLLGVACIAYVVYELVHFSRWDVNPDIRQPAQIFRGACGVVMALATVVALLAILRKRLEGVLEWIIQYLVSVSLIFIIVLVDPWISTALVYGRQNEGAIALPLIFKHTESLSSGYGTVLLLGSVGTYLAVVMQMRFRRLVWICCTTLLVYVFVTLMYKRPSCLRSDGEETLCKDPDEWVSSEGFLTPAALLILYLITLFGKIQIEMLQRRNFLELELAQLRIDVLERTLDAVGREGAAMSRSEETQKRLKDAERILQKVRHLRGAGSAEVDDDLETVINALKDTSRTITIMDFQKEVLIGPIRTGIEYNEDEIARWVQDLAGSRSVDVAALSPHREHQSRTTTVMSEPDLGLSAKSLMKRIGVDWDLNPSELEITLRANSSSNLSAFGLTARALIAPHTTNMLYGVSDETVSGFIGAVESAYLNVPFHNADRAALVAHHAACLMSITGVKKFVPAVDRLALIIASLCIDVGHFGRSNSFLVESKHELAVRYNDTSVLENFHASKVFELMRAGGPMTDISAVLSPADFKKFRNRTIQLILATDPVHHFSQTAELRLRLMSNPRMFSESEIVEADRRIALVSIIAAADLGCYTMPYNTHLFWANHLADELALQGDDERGLILPISPMCDRESQKLPNMMSGVLDMLVVPLYKEVFDLAAQVNPGDHTAKSKIEGIDMNIYDNRRKWNELRGVRGSRPVSRSCSGIEFLPAPATDRAKGLIVSIGESESESEDRPLLKGGENSGSSDDGEPPMVSFADVRKI